MAHNARAARANAGVAAGTALAVIDRRGMLHVADQGLSDLMRREWPNWTGPVLPPLLVEHLPSHEFLGELVTSKLRYYPTVTRESYRNMGRITELIENNKMFDDLGVPTINPAEDRVMICGSPAMLRDLKHLLEKRGFKEGNTSTPGDFVIERAFAEQ